MKTVSAPVEVVLNGHVYLLEEGDKVDFMSGGLADNHTVENIAKKHGVVVEFIEEQLEMGIEVELEHTNDEKLAREIAVDHLWEIPDYYTRLKNMEEEGVENEGVHGVRGEGQ